MPNSSVNLTELSMLLDAHPDTIKSWVSPKEFDGGMPCLQFGGAGRAYIFDVDACRLWVRRREQERAQCAVIAAAIIASRREALDEVKNSPSHSETILIRDRKDYYQAEMVLMKMARERGDLVEAVEVVREFNDLFQSVSKFLQALPDRIERECCLSLEKANLLREAIEVEQSKLARELMNR